MKRLFKILIVGAYLILLAFEFPINDESVPEEHQLFPEDADATRGCFCGMREGSDITITRNRYLQFVNFTSLPESDCSILDHNGRVTAYNGKWFMCDNGWKEFQPDQ